MLDTSSIDDMNVPLEEDLDIGVSVLAESNNRNAKIITSLGYSGHCGLGGG